MPLSPSHSARRATTAASRQARCRAASPIASSSGCCRSASSSVGRSASWMRTAPRTPRSRRPPGGGRRRHRGCGARCRHGPLVAACRRRSRTAVGGLHRHEGNRPHPRARVERHAREARHHDEELARLHGDPRGDHCHAWGDVMGARRIAARRGGGSRAGDRATRRPLALDLAQAPASRRSVDDAAARGVPGRNRRPSSQRALRLLRAAQPRALGEVYGAVGYTSVFLFWMYLVGRLVITAPILNVALADELRARRGGPGTGYDRRSPPHGEGPTPT